jgi:enterochelin esterase family protein
VSSPSIVQLAREGGNPVIDDSGATFVWAGPAPAPTVVGSWCDWDAEAGLALRPVDGGWAARVPLPEDAYVEDILLREGRRVPDPLNRRRVDNGVGGRNQRFWMPGAARRLEALHARGAASGTINRGMIQLGWMAAEPRQRRLDLYLPAGAGNAAPDRRDLPLLLVLDGPDYLDRGRLDLTLDALIADGAMAPVAAAFIGNAGPNRGTEYVANDFTLASLVHEVVPAAADRLGLDPAVGGVTILGSSMGGLMALHAATRRPDVFGAAICQSTAMVEEDDVPRGLPFRGVRLTTIALMQATDPAPVRLWLDAGDLEGLATPNDRLAALLERRGYGLTYRRFPGGHDQTSGGESLIDALPAMFPPTGG